MRLTFRSWLILFVFLALALSGCRKDQKAAPQEQTAPASSDPDKAAVEKTIIDQAKALSDFTTTQDPQSFLKYYSNDYAGITEGEQETLSDLSNMLSEIQADAKKNSKAGIKETVSNIKVQGTGNFAWAVYDFVQTFGDGDDEIAGKCTSILRKDNGSWIIIHRHTSIRNDTDYDNSSDKGDPDSKH